MAAVWALVALAVVVGLLPVQAPISNDGIQYVSGAENLLAGQGYATSILFFDEHYRFGRIPAPQTVWPPGYSVAIAALGAVGVELEEAARWIPRLCFVLLLPLIYLLAWRVTGRPRAATLTTLWTFTVTELWLYTASVNTDLPFLAISVAALAVIPNEDDPPARWLAPGLLSALAATFRYAGVFLIAALGLVALGVAWHRSKRAGTLQPTPLLWLILGASPFVLILVRNTLLLGSLQGGNTKPVSQPLAGLLDTTFRVLVDLLTGASLTAFRTGGWRTVAAGVGLVGAVILAGLVLISLRGTGEGDRSRARGPVAAAAWLYPLVYCVALLWTASRTMLTYGARYLLPILPLLMLITIQMIQRAERPGKSGRPGWATGEGARYRLGLVAVLAIFVAQTAALERRWEARGSPFPDDRLFAWVREELADGPVLAVGSGQQVGHLLQLPTAAVPPQMFTALPWDEAMVRDVISRYRIRTVIVHRSVADARYGGFLDNLAAGEPPPLFEEAASSGMVRILRVQPDSGAASARVRATNEPRR